MSLAALLLLAVLMCVRCVSCCCSPFPAAAASAASSIHSPPPPPPHAASIIPLSSIVHAHFTRARIARRHLLQRRHSVSLELKLHGRAPPHAQQQAAIGQAAQHSLRTRSAAQLCIEQLAYGPHL
jgi:hypothetical protein